MKKINCLVVFCVFFIFLSCSDKSVPGAKKEYRITGFEAARIEMDSTWDKNADPEMIRLVDSYKNKLEAQMSEEIGTAARTLVKDYPQGLLSNFTADAMKLFIEKKGENVDFAIINNGGLRSTLNEGKITIGAMFEIYSFENQLVLLDVPGEAVKELFSYLAVNGGEALSTGLRFVIKDRKVKSLHIGGQAFDENKTYRIVTVDFLAEGNSGMEALTKAVKYTAIGTTLRDAITQHIKEKTRQGELIDAQLDDRIKIE